MMCRGLLTRGATSISLSVLLLLLTGCAEFLDTLPVSDPMSGDTPADGLREALRVGTARAVTRLGQENGYWNSPEVRIPLPDKLDRPASALRAIGAGAGVDRFELSMNRAAEAAAPEAKRVFLGAIREMTFADAMAILRGSGQEATDYLRQHAGPQLGAAFRPIVAAKLDSVGVTRNFQELVDDASRLPFINKPVFDLEAYVTDEAIAGLFRMIGREEEKIRKDPLARTTELLRKYFG